MSHCFSKSTACAWKLRQAKRRNLSNNQSCVNLGWCWSISVHFPTLWFLPVTVYLDTIHWLSTLAQEEGWSSEDRDIIQELSLLHMSSCIHSLSLPLSFCFWTKTKSEMKTTLQKEENPVLDHSQASIFQKHISKPPRALWVHMAAPQETWIHASHSATVTAISK